MTPRRPSVTHPARVKHADVNRLWNAVEGAVIDAMNSHPEYYTRAGHLNMVASITKRAVGSVTALLTRKGGRTVGSRAGVIFTDAGVTDPASRGLALPANPHHHPDMWAWPIHALTRRDRRILRQTIKRSRLRFVAFHRGPHGLVYVQVQR